MNQVTRKTSHPVLSRDFELDLGQSPLLARACVMCRRQHNRFRGRSASYHTIHPLPRLPFVPVLMKWQQCNDLKFCYSWFVYKRGLTIQYVNTAQLIIKRKKKANILTQSVPSDPRLSFGFFLPSELLECGSAHTPAIKKGLFWYFICDIKFFSRQIDKCNCNTVDCRSVMWK